MTADPALTAELDVLLGRTLNESGVPGAAVGIVVDGEVWTTASGITSVEHPLPVSTETVFQAGSITKTYTGTAVMRLVEQGVLELHRPVRDYVPELRLASPDVAERVTLWHLLTHTGGWEGDRFDDTGRGDDALRILVEQLASSAQISPLGAVWSYNNAAVCLAGHVIERVQGCSYEDAIRRLVLEPLGCERSFFFADEVITHRFAVGHLKHEDGTAHVARPWAMPRSIGPAGGLACSIEDLMRYASAYLSPTGETLLDPASIAEMTRPQVDAGAMFDAMGLSWMLDEVDGTTLAFHSGDTNGQVASLLLVPSRRFAVGVLTNCDDAYGVYTPLTDWCLEAFTGLRRQAPAVHALDAAALGEYAGRYETRLTHMDVHARDGGIEVDVFPHAYLDDMEELPPPIRVEAGFYAPDRMVVTSGPYARLRSDFVRGDDGRIRWFRFGGRLSARAEAGAADSAAPAESGPPARGER